MKSDKPSKFPNLTIRYVRGLDPIIKLFDENNNVQEVRNFFMCCLLSYSACNLFTKNSERMQCLISGFKKKNLFVFQVLAIERWDTDAVEEFLKTHLHSPY